MNNMERSTNPAQNELEQYCSNLEITYKRYLDEKLQAFKQFNKNRIKDIV